MLFFIFDTVHILKCIRNNWQSKKNDDGSLCFIDTDNDNILFTAKYRHLEKLYEIINGMMKNLEIMVYYTNNNKSSISKEENF